MNKKGFTLAEMLIVLAILGVVGSLLISLVQFIIPDQNDAKIRKAYNTLFQTVSYLTNDGSIYREGKLNGYPEKKEDGTNLTSNDKNQYFCKHFADQLSTNGAINCGGTGTTLTTQAITSETDLAEISKKLDAACGTTCANVNCSATCTKTANRSVAFRTSDGVSWFGINDDFSAQDKHDGIDYRYVVVCADSDISDTSVCPVSFGVRQDGKILVGNHAQQILDKTGKKD